MDEKRLLLAMAERLYIDIKFVTEQNPTQIVDDDGARAYNSILKRTRSIYGSQLPPLADFPDWTARNIKYKDALVVAGQLYALLRAAGESTSARPTPTRRPPTGTGNPTSEPSTARAYSMASLGQPTPLPAEPTSRRQQPPPDNPEPPKRNDDGTIPFTLE